MRAATPKADHSLRSAAAFGAGSEGANPPGFSQGNALPPGIPPFRPAMLDTGWSPEAANDAVEVRKAPFSPVLLGALVLLLDVIAIVGAGMAADAMTGSAGARHASTTLLIAGLTVACGIALGSYKHAVLFSIGRQLRLALVAAGGAIGATLAAAFAFGVIWRVDPLWLAVALPFATLTLLCGRAAVVGLVRHGASRTARRAVILGAGPQATRMLAALKRDPAGLDVIGLVDERPPRGMSLPAGVPNLGGLQALFGMIRRGEVDCVVIAVPWSADARLAMLIERLSAFPVDICLAPDLLVERIRGARPAMPALICPRPISGLAGAAKRLEDIVLGSVALAVAAVPMMLIAAAVRLDSPGPVFFRQRRTGFNDQPFDVLKFRTMYADQSDHEVRRQVLAGDPRVTPVGAILRRTSLDELPQLLNVLRGEMSFVGPRPHAPATRAGTRRFDEVVANYAARHRVKPGLTGLAAVRGWRGPTLTEEQILKRVESDMEYIERWSLWLDFTIILRTLLAVVRMRNAL